MKFKKGDMGTVRGWDEMKKEFGVEGGNIKCSGTFTNHMKVLCGKAAIVEECIVDENMKHYRLRPMAVEDLELDWGWTFTDDMLE